MKKLIYCPKKNNSKTIKFGSQKDLAQIIKEKDFVVAIPKDAKLVYFLSLKGGDIYLTYIESRGEVVKCIININCLMEDYDIYTFSDEELINKLLEN